MLPCGCLQAGTCAGSHAFSSHAFALFKLGALNWEILVSVALMSTCPGVCEMDLDKWLVFCIFFFFPSSLSADKIVRCL